MLKALVGGAAGAAARRRGNAESFLPSQRRALYDGCFRGAPSTLPAPGRLRPLCEHQVPGGRGDRFGSEVIPLVIRLRFGLLHHESQGKGVTHLANSAPSQPWRILRAGAEIKKPGHPGSICTIHADSPRETLPRLVRLALRNPQAPRAETVLGEIVHTVDLVLYAGFARSARDRHRLRRLLSVGTVAGINDGRPVVQELVALGDDGSWHQVGSLAAMPERVRAKLARVCEPTRLLDDVDG